MSAAFQAQDDVFIIAEIGGNHEGDFDYARKLTDLAIESGADAIKFQVYTGDSLVNKMVDPDRNRHFQKFQLSPDQYLELAHQCKSANVRFMASVWDIDAYDWIDEKLTIYKVGSGDLTAFNHLHRIAKTGKPIILSTGLSSIQQIQSSIDFIGNVDSDYKSKGKLALLQCTSLYPNRDEQVHLNAMIHLRNQFDLPVGYSDHTTGEFALELAVSMGARILETHFTDNREGKTFRDHFVSLTCDEIKGLRKRISIIRQMQGEIEKQVLPAEIESKHHLSFRRAVYPVKPLKKGHNVKEEDLVTLRPLKGICASHFYTLIGKATPRDFEAYEPLGDLSLWKL